MRISDVIGLVALMIAIVIGIIIVGNMIPVSETVGAGLGNTTSGTDFNATAATLFGNTWTALTLASIGMIIAAAVGILALVVSALGGRPTAAGI